MFTIPTEVATIGFSIIGSSAAAFLITKVLGGVAGKAGAYTAGVLQAELHHVVASPLLYAAIESELHSIAADPDAAEATVEAVAQKILARVAPEFPAATFSAVIGVVGQFARAFVAGLDTPEPPTPVVAPPSASAKSAV